MLLLAALLSLSTEERAIQYLAKEVPAWSRENKCFSCHNNGDGARALYRARKLGYAISTEALAETTAWLAKPKAWDESRGDPAFSDKKLARIQFAAALLESDGPKRTLTEAADALLEYQERDGSWQVDASTRAGSPVTYGTALATYQVRRVLEAAGRDRYATQLAAIDRWFVNLQPTTISEAASAILAGSKKSESLNFILGSQTADGGWGPWRGAPAETFDTALALLALAELPSSDRPRDAITRGRQYLIRTQAPAGGWPETTRPSGGQSYAQHISTSAWATMALLATNSGAK